jgi:hypothetical protein
MKITTDHSRLSTLHPDQLADMFRHGTLNNFDESFSRTPYHTLKGSLSRSILFSPSLLWSTMVLVDTVTR